MKKRGFHVALTEEERKEILRLKKQGVPNRRIGEMLGRSCGTICQAYKPRTKIFQKHF